MATKSNRSSGTQINNRGIAQGNTLVDPVTGLPVDVIEDNQGIRRLAVDSGVTFTLPNDINVDLDAATDGVHIGNPITGDILQVEPDGSINTNTELDASDGDNIAISSHPLANQIFDEASDTLTTANFEQIFSFTSSNNNTRIITIEATSEATCVFQLKINGLVKRTKRSSASERNVTFTFKEHRPLSSGDILTVEAKIESPRIANYDTFTSLEGYLA